MSGSFANLTQSVNSQAKCESFDKVNLHANLYAKHFTQGANSHSQILQHEFILKREFTAQIHKFTNLQSEFTHEFTAAAANFTAQICRENSRCGARIPLSLSLSCWASF